MAIRAPDGANNDGDYAVDDGGDPEAQKPGWQGGIATRKVFARPESFCA